MIFGRTPLATALMAMMATASSGNFFFASAFSDPPQDRYVNTGSNTHFVCRVPHVIGSGARSKLRIVLPNWALVSGDNNGPAAFTRVGLEANGQFAAVTFSGARNTTLAAGTTKVESDDILPSSFGLSNFAVGSTVYVRIECTAVNGVNRVVLGGRYNQAANTLYQYNSATAVCNFDTTGAIAFTSGTSGTDYSTFTTNGMTALAHGLIGAFVGPDQPVWLCCGDSIEAGVGDTSNTTSISGWWQKGCFDSDLLSNPIANMKFCISGIKYQQFSAVLTRVQGWAAYANRGFDGLGTNDLSAGTALATIQGYASSLWTALKTPGTITKLYHHKLLAYVTTTDSYATEANQTYFNTYWSTGNNADGFDAYLAAQVGTGITGLLTFTNVAGTDPRKWYANGTANYSTSDGIHPSAAQHTNMANQWRTFRQAVG